ncbi:MAG: hypothetical protein ABH885_01445, partial [Candidatus Omnitrophota bacterium]
LAPISRFSQKAWDREVVDAVRARERGEVAYDFGKALTNRTAFYYISNLIGRDLLKPPSAEMREPVSSATRAQSLIEEIKRHVDPAELEVSRSRPDLDPILHGFELNELAYNTDENSYELPLYRDGIATLQYKFFTEGDPEPTDMVIPVVPGHGTLYVRVEERGTKVLTKELERGKKIFDAYAGILNRQGKAIAARIETYLGILRSGRITVPSDLDMMNDIVGQIPSVNNPHLELFVDPNPGNEDAMEFIQGYIGLEITTGCPRQCLFCELKPQNRLVQMPYPMVLKMLDILKQKLVFATDKNIKLYFGSDPFAYCDHVIGADLADVVEAAAEREIPVSIVTSGWKKENKLAQLAAERIAAMSYDPIDLCVTVHPYFGFVSEAVKAGRGDEITRKLVEEYENVLSTLKRRRCGVIYKIDGEGNRYPELIPVAERLKEILTAKFPQSPDMWIYPNFPHGYIIWSPDTSSIVCDPGFVFRASGDIMFMKPKDTVKMSRVAGSPQNAWFRRFVDILRLINYENEKRGIGGLEKIMRGPAYAVKVKELDDTERRLLGLDGISDVRDDDFVGFNQCDNGFDAHGFYFMMLPWFATGNIAAMLKDPNAVFSEEDYGALYQALSELPVIRSLRVELANMTPERHYSRCNAWTVGMCRQTRYSGLHACWLRLRRTPGALAPA